MRSPVNWRMLWECNEVAKPQFNRVIANILICAVYRSPIAPHKWYSALHISHATHCNRKQCLPFNYWIVLHILSSDRQAMHGTMAWSHRTQAMPMPSHANIHPSIHRRWSSPHEKRYSIIHNVTLFIFDEIIIMLEGKCALYCY